MRLADLSFLLAGVAAILPAGRAFAATDSAREGEVVAVLDFRLSVDSDTARRLQVPFLADRVRAAASRALPDAQVIARDELIALLPDLAAARECDGACAAKAGRDIGADLVVSGSLAQGKRGYVLSLELREADDGTAVGTATAIGANADELADASEGAVADLFRPLKSAPAAAVVAIGPVALPDLPAPAGEVREGGAVNLDVDAHVLVAYDGARTAEVNGSQHPDDAAAAWNAVAQPPGTNPFRELAAARAARWTAYAEGKRAFEAQYSKDRSRLRKVLPLKWVADNVKLELLVRYAHAYGANKATALLALLRPATAREHAGFAIGCEGKQAAACIAMARAADVVKDRAAAVDYLDRACSAGSADACTAAGERWLQTGTREVPKAISALQRGCAAQKGAACARLARLHEEGDGVKTDLAMAVQLREQACNAGDGRSCRRLAALVETDSPNADLTHARELWAKGCAAGDQPSCVLAGKTAQARPQPAPQIVAPTRPAQVAVAPPPPAVVAPPEQPAFRPQVVAQIPPLAPAVTSTAERRSQIGLALFAVSVVAAGSVVFMVGNDRPDAYDAHYHRAALVAAPASSGGGFPTRTAAMVGLGAAAALSAGAGAVLFFSKPEQSKPQLGVSVAPNGLLLSGTLP